MASKTAAGGFRLVVSTWVYNTQENYVPSEEWVARARAHGVPLDAVYPTLAAAEAAARQHTAAGLGPHLEAQALSRTGHIEHVYDLLGDDGRPVYWLDTDDGHSYGPFPAAGEARRCAARHGITVRGHVRRRKSLA